MDVEMTIRTACHADVTASCSWLGNQLPPRLREERFETEAMALALVASESKAEAEATSCVWIAGHV
jgi:hypothetical protein